jgi:tRNA (guanine-N7-)-methyltransferase
MQQELENFQNRRFIRSFGRIKSRKLSDHKNFLLENFLPLYKIKSFDLFSYEKHCLEIGFGFGDFLFEKAKKNPDILFFGCEPHINGIVNLLSKLEKEPLQNLQISSQDVRIFLGRLPEKIFDQIFILFPDPWPKLKHFKRRLINLDFLDRILSPKMKNGAKLIIATDHISYQNWILSEILLSKKFSWQINSAKERQNFPEDWVKTKYQKKAENAGRNSVIFNLIHHA